MGCANEVIDGYCRTFMSHQTTVIDKDHPIVSPITGKKYTWTELVQIAVIFPPWEWAIVKEWFDQYCHERNNCTGIGDWNSVVQDFGQHLSSTETTLGQKAKPFHGPK